MGGGGVFCFVFLDSSGVCVFCVLSKHYTDAVSNFNGLSRYKLYFL